MKNSLFIYGLVAIAVCGCTAPPYLPPADEIDVSKFGSHIKIIRKNAPALAGELIAIDRQQIIVLPQDSRRCEMVSIDEVKRFTLRYARPRHYGWTIPLGFFISFVHGMFFILSEPVNLVVTVIVTVSGETDFKYSDKNMTYEQLTMFARFPQGIPPQVDWKQIR
jgi:hypothetical protein